MAEFDRDHRACHHATLGRVWAAVAFEVAKQSGKPPVGIVAARACDPPFGLFQPFA